MNISQLPANMARKVRHDGATDCWEWTGAVQSKGYGSGNGKDGHWLAHRRSYELLVGPIPEGLTIDHLCRNRLCVNPGHMEPVSSAVNTRRGIDHAISSSAHYPCGHVRNDSNTLIKQRSNGWINRTCRECNRSSVRKTKLAGATS